MSDLCRAREDEARRDVESATDWTTSALNFCKFLVGLGVVSCAPDSDAMWHGDTRFTTEERAAIVEGEAWIARQGGHEPGGVEFDYVVTSSQSLRRTIRRERGPAKALGESYGEAVWLGLDGREETKEQPLKILFLPGLTAHEMAHCRYGFGDRYGEGREQSDWIMRVLYPMRWTPSEEAQCVKTGCRE